MLKLLIFDLDGTLVDTAKDIADAINFAVEPFTHKTYSIEETKAMVGSGISKLLETLISSSEIFHDNEKSAAQVVVDRFLKFYSEHLLDNTETYPHVRETLSRLGSYRKAVVSNKREIFSRQILEGLGVLQYFDVVLGSDSVPEKKPSPVPVLKLLERFGVSRNEAVITGDSNYDVEAGRAAGVTTIAVTYGFRSREVLKDADFIIDRFDELLKILPELDKKRFIL
ncbi:MAG: HAD family hydrolase [Nitrospiraceae bacterium]|nr:MAG: HAD family hydrolase [Nitrospiraceae bacterium]